MPLAMKNKRTPLRIVLLTLLLTSSFKAQTRQWRPMTSKALIAFDWNCSRKDSFPNQSLHSVVAHSIPLDDRRGPMTYGDRAFVMKLRRSGPGVYFVPTVCSATGNCTWRLYTLNPVRL